MLLGREYRDPGKNSSDSPWQGRYRAEAARGPSFTRSRPLLIAAKSRSEVPAA